VKLVTKSGVEKRRKEVSAKPLNAAQVQPLHGNGASPSNHDVLRRLYSSMLKCRMATERAQRLPGGRQPADYDFDLGHEAVVIGATLELGPEDTIAASPRNFTAQIAKGTSLKDLLSPKARRNGLQTPAVANGLAWASTASFDPFNLGTGLALAHRFEKRRNVVVALCAEDTAPPDRLHEAMKFAGIHRLPIIYVLKSDSTFELGPAKRNPVLEELSFMERDCGFPAIIVDSNDAVAVWRVAQESIHRARNGGGPTLIECETQSSYANDPLAQMEHYMKKRGAWDDQWRQDTTLLIEAEMEAAAARKARPHNC
jgi:TPP-dependent pyruvate/acetoin dehydrogenase alpha subunit